MASTPAVNKSPTFSCNHEAHIIVFHGSQDPISNTDHANAINRNQGLKTCIGISQHGDIAKKLDTSEQNPCKNQGDLVVLSIAENVIDRTGKSGANGIGVKEDVSYTLNTAGTPGVCVPLDMRNATRDPEKRDETNRQRVGVDEDGDPMNTLTTVHVPGVAYEATKNQQPYRWTIKRSYCKTSTASSGASRRWKRNG